MAYQVLMLEFELTAPFIMGNTNGSQVLKQG